MEATRLGQAAARHLLDQLGDELGRADQRRLEQLLERPLDPDPRIRLSEALSILYPEQSREAGLTSFRQLRNRVQAAAKEAGVPFALAADTRTRSAPEDRWCWFEGEDLTLDQLSLLSQKEVQASATQDPVPQKAVLLDGKPVVRHFISYAKLNAKLAKDLIERLQVRLGNSPEFRFQPWQFGDILAGERWHAEIQAAIDQCTFGLLLVSHEFLASGYISDHELPHFVPQNPSQAGGRRRAVPVGLKPVPFDGSVDLKGLGELQVFRDREARFFSERTAETTKERFADELFQQVLRITRKLTAPPSPPGAASRSDEPEPDEPERLAAGLRCQFPAEESFRFVRTRAALASLEKMEEPSDGAGVQVDAVDTLLEWAAKPDDPPFFALLGEYGMGKTTTCEAFTRRLLEARENDAALPVPVYVDLRRLGDKARSEPPLASILESVLGYSTRSGQAMQGLAADRVIALVREGKALAIFDGLDEVLVHLTPAQGQRFTRQLWSILPTRERRGPRKADDKPVGPARGKLLISCRTHFFRTLREERTHFTGEDREALSAADYRALLLLPFTDSQIEEYLEKHLPGADVPRLKELIRSIHNLPELAERPYTLSLIAKHIPQLEQWKLESRKVTGVTLYRHMVQSWLERDMGKHQLTMDHKQRLMERFAAELWRSGKRSWKVEDVEQWLIDFLAENPRLAAHYEGKDRELLKEDLRTATFLVREGEDEFRFAHTSLLEFFIASHLARALKDRRLDAWDLPRPSLETLDFLGQMLAEEEGAASWPVWREIRNQYRPRVSELMLAYALRAQARSLPMPALAGFQLQGADLRGWEIEGKKGAPLLNIRGASFRGARLRGARFERVDLSEADFANADFQRGTILDSRARTVRLGPTALAGALFREVDFQASDFGGAKLHRTQWLHCHLDGVSGLQPTGAPGLFARCEPAAQFPSSDAPGEARLIALAGHDGEVNACTFSPDGARLASAGDDGTVRLWDASSGEALAVLEGHRNGVMSCAFSPDGARLASTGDDGTVRLWDASSGEALAVLEGHRNGVMSCAFSPDGARLASTGYDRTVRLWDASSGEALAVLEGHGDVAKSCTFSSDGARLAWARYDGTVRLWDGSSGEVLAVLEGHRSGVWSCAFSPDGARLASAGDDGSVRLWDASSGKALAVLEGHTSLAWSCAFSPDGARLASSAGDAAGRLWDVSSGEVLAVLEGHSSVVWSCAFSPDGARLATVSSDRTVRLWDASSGKALAVLEGHRDEVWSCAFSPDGARLASASEDGTLRLWDASSGEPLAVFEGHGDVVRSCAFSPDDGRVASTGRDGSVRVWDASSGELLAVLEGHRGGVKACAFSTDGARLASAGDDGTLRLWSATSGEALAVLEGHRGRVRSCAFSPDGARLASAGSDGTVRLWDLATGEPVAWRAELLPAGEFAVLRADGSGAIQVSPGAWRWLGWVGIDPATGQLNRWPAEVFGPLPEVDLAKLRKPAA